MDPAQLTQVLQQVGQTAAVQEAWVAEQRAALAAAQAQVAALVAAPAAAPPREPAGFRDRLADLPN